MATDRMDAIRGTAKVIQGESMIAGAYVSHSASLGTLREKIVRSIIRKGIPDKYRIDTGFVCLDQKCSRQCDILIHESTEKAPLYQYDDFVVVSADCARAAIEIKSDLDGNGFENILQLTRSIEDIAFQNRRDVYIPVFGYGLTGFTFETLLTKIVSALENEPLEGNPDLKQFNWPFCIAIQDRHIFAARLCDVFYILDFNEHKIASDDSIDGLETGYFTQVLLETISSGPFLKYRSWPLSWFNTGEINDCGKAWITVDGVIHRGSYPGAVISPGAIG